MNLYFSLQNQPSIEIRNPQCIIAGWAGRDITAIEHHIEELAALGVPRPSDVPLFYRITTNQLSQNPYVEVVGKNSSGEAEVLIFNHHGELFISLASDHTDRNLESYSVALSKQVCVKPIATTAWLYSEVANHWDQLQLKAWIEENGKNIPYQNGELSSLLHPLELIEKFFHTPVMPEGYVMTCGTVATIGGIKSASTFKMQLYDPVLNRTIEHKYIIKELPEVM